MRFIPPSLRVALRLAVILPVAWTALALSAPTGRAQTGGDTPVAVAIAGFSYDPEELTVPVGALVRWTNDDAAPHDIVSDDRSFVSALLETGQSYQTRFAEPGRFSYYCSIHPSMVGSVTVRAQAPPGQARVFLPQMLR